MKAEEGEASPCAGMTREIEGADCGYDRGATAVAGANYGGGAVMAGVVAAMEAAQVEEASMELQWRGRV